VAVGRLCETTALYFVPQSVKLHNNGKRRFGGSEPKLKTDGREYQRIDWDTFDFQGASLARRPHRMMRRATNSNKKTVQKDKKDNKIYRNKQQCKMTDEHDHAN
jgi:hypothetical protein